MTPTELRALAADILTRHKSDDYHDGSGPECCDCHDVWPCDAALLANAVPDLLDRIEVLEGALEIAAAARHRLVHSIDQDGHDWRQCQKLECQAARAALEGADHDPA